MRPAGAVSLSGEAIEDAMCFGPNAVALVHI